MERYLPLKFVITIILVRIFKQFAYTPTQKLSLSFFLLWIANQNELKYLEYFTGLEGSNRIEGVIQLEDSFVIGEGMHLLLKFPYYSDGTLQDISILLYETLFEESDVDIRMGAVDTIISIISQIINIASKFYEIGLNNRDRKLTNFVGKLVRSEYDGHVTNCEVIAIDLGI